MGDIGNGCLTVGVTGLEKSVVLEAGQTVGITDKLDVYGLLPGGDHVSIKEVEVPTITVRTGGIHPHRQHDQSGNSTHCGSVCDRPGLEIGKPSVRAPIVSCPANLFHWLFASCFILVIGSSMSCETHPNLIIHQSEAAWVALRELPADYPSLGPNHHPYTISPKKMLTLLEPLEYREELWLPFTSGRPRRVFTTNQGTMLAQELSKALGSALPQEVVTFTVADEEKPDRRTKGFTFIVGDELHLIIEELRRPVYQGERKPYQQQLFQWELLPASRQRHYTSRPGGKGVISNWIITPLR